MIHLRRFTGEGLTQFDNWLDLVEAGAPADSTELLENEGLTETLSEVPVVDGAPLGTRRQAAEALHAILQPHEDRVDDVERDRGLWSWLSLVWFDELAPMRDDGTRAVGARYRYIPAIDNYRQYYRHLLAGAYRVFRAHIDDPDRAMAVLSTPVSSPGDVVEQLTSRQELVTSPGLMAAATKLYVEEDGRLRRGAAGRGPGSARRLPRVLDQFDLTWDIQAMDAEGILSLLPAEFDRFQP